MLTSFLPCSFPLYHNAITSAADMCMYKIDRQIKEHLVIPVGNDVANDDAHGIRSLTIAQLKLELCTRDLNNTGLKAELIARIVAALEADDTVGTPEADDSKYDFDKEDRILNG